jgi:hypothetical protein
MMLETAEGKSVAASGADFNPCLLTTPVTVKGVIPFVGRSPTASSRAMRLMQSGRYADAKTLLEAHLKKDANDTEGWETYWDLMRISQQDPTFAIVQAARAYAHHGDTPRAKRLLHKNEIELTLREAVQIAKVFSDDDGDALLHQAVRRNLADPLAPNAILGLLRTHRTEDHEVTARAVLEHATDSELRHQLERALRSA